MREFLIVKVNELLNKISDSSSEKEKYIYIKKILEEPNCFKKMSTETSFSILRDMGISENELIDVYFKLINE